MLLRRPAELLNDGKGYANPNIPLPANLYPDRKNSSGLDFGDRVELDILKAGLARVDTNVHAVPLIPGVSAGSAKDSVKSPVDHGVVGYVTNATPEAVAEAVKVAKAGYKIWSKVAVADRAAILDKAADLLEQRLTSYLAMLSREAGKTLEDGVSEVREAADFCRYYARQSIKLFGEPEVLPGPTGEDNRLIHRGRGAFVCISPWNFPLAIFAGQVVAALAAGNAVLAKPAEQTPLVAYAFVRLLHEAGVPKDALLFVPGDGKVGAALTSHPNIDGVCFTGSTETAWVINRTLAAKNGPIVPLIAETGGMNAMIVDATALPEQVADDVVSSAFRSAGQRCSALRLLFVQEDVADRMLTMIEGAASELKLGNPSDLNTDVGPVIDAEQLAMLNSHIDAMRKTQKVRFAGTVPNGGLFFAPHVVELKKAEDLTREIFGPVLHVVRYKAGQLDKVLDAIQATGFGLTLGIHTRIEETIEKVTARLDTGNIYVNRNMIGAVVGTQPFGGSGLSGTGFKAGGPHYLLRFALEQVVSVNTAAAGGNASLIAMGE